MDDIYMEKISVEKKLTNYVIVNKLHNMQWLRNAPHSSRFGKTKVVREQKQDYDSNNQTDDLLIKDDKENPVEESDEHDLTIDTPTKHSSTDIISENDGITWNNDIDAVNTPQTVRRLGIEEFEEEGILSMAVVESIVTAKLEAHCCIDEEQRDQANLSQNNIENDAQDAACANISNLQEVDWDKKELVKRSDDNNNYSKLSAPIESCMSDTQRTTFKTTDEKNINASKGTPKKGVYVKDRFNNKRVFTKKLKGDTQWTDNTNQSKNIQFTGNNNSFYNAAQESAIIVSSQQPQNKHLQQSVLQTEKQMSPQRTASGKFHDHLSVNNTMRSSHILNTCNTASYVCNVETTSSDNNVVPMSMSPFKDARDSDKQYLNTLHRQTPNIQQKPVAMFPDFSNHLAPCQTSTWNPPVQEVGQFVNTTQPASMCMYSPETCSPNNFDNTHATNYSLPPPIAYTPSPYMQMWNPQLQCSTPTFQNSPYMTYTMFPNIANQSNNFNDIAVGSMPMYADDQQHKYIPCIQTNNLTHTGLMQMRTNSNYIKGPHHYNFNNCAVETRNTIDNIPMRTGQYYKNYQDNYRAVYDVPQRATPISYHRSQQPFVPVGINQCNTYYPPNQKQNIMNYMQISKNPKHESMQDLCEDNEVEDIPPIIFPKEFVTNKVNFSNKTDQLATRVFTSSQRCDGIRRDTACQDVPKRYTSFSNVGRGASKFKRM